MSGKPLGVQFATAVMLIAALAACSGDQDELQEWMKQQTREVKPNVQPLSPPKKFVPQPYSEVSAVEPFSTQKLTVALKQEARQPNSLLNAEINRRKEPLEVLGARATCWRSSASLARPAPPEPTDGWVDGG